MRIRIVAVAVAAASTLLAYEELGSGTWRLSVDKSHFSGMPPKSATITWRLSNNELQNIGERVSASGTVTRMIYKANFDGKDYPVTGSDAIDSIAIKRTGAHTFEQVTKKAGVVVSTATTVLSNDGTIMTMTVRGQDVRGVSFRNVNVFERDYADDPVIGTWKLDIAASTFIGRPPKSVVATYQAVDGHVRYTEDLVRADGSTLHIESIGRPDGRPYPVIGYDRADSVVYRRINANTTDVTLIRQGNVVSVLRRTVAPDRRTMTVTRLGASDSKTEQVYSRE